MNGKVCRKLRQIAKIKAHSWKDHTFQGAKGFRNILTNSSSINAKDGVFYQSKLDPTSVGAIVKKMKRLFQLNNHRDKREMFSVFEYVIKHIPKSFGIPETSS